MDQELKYMDDIVQLLEQVEWLHNFQVTQIFTRSILDNMPCDWRNVLYDLPLDVLNAIPQCSYEVNWPPSLQHFLNECQRLSLHKLLSAYNSNKNLKHQLKEGQDQHIPPELIHNMSVKKRHEVSGVVKLLEQLTQITGSTHILDIGSGKGYVDSCLHRILGMCVLGAESETKLVDSATQRQIALSGKCERIQHIEWSLEDNEETLLKAQEVMSKFTATKHTCTCRTKRRETQEAVSSTAETRALETERPTSPTKRLTSQVETKSLHKSDDHHSCIIVGLHACADLSPIMIKIFKASPQASSLALLSCCYHKLQRKLETNIQTSKAEFKTSPVYEDSDEISEAGFNNFPLSQALRKSLDRCQLRLGVATLRLAAQESGQRWRDYTTQQHEQHCTFTSFRALLEVVCNQDNLTLRKLRRRCVRKSQFGSLVEYVDNVWNNYEFIDKVKNDEYSGGGGGGGGDGDNDGDSAMIVTERNKGIKTTKDKLTVKNERTNTKISNTEDERTLTKNQIRVSKITKSYILSAMEGVYNKHQHLLPLIEPLAGLQLALQPVIEALILLDRVLYLRECGFEQVWLEKVFEDCLSPRSVALMAVR